MRPRLLVIASICLLATSALGQSKVLFLTHSAGFKHGVIRRAKQGQAAWAEHNLKKFAGQQFEVVATKDCSLINAENLKNYAAVVFYTTGELPISNTNRKAMYEWIRSGGGFIGIHCATDTLYKDPEYGELVGGYFAGHPWHMKVPILVENSNHPATALLGKRFEFTDEIYQFKNFKADNVNVLLRLDPSFSQIKKGRHKDTDYYAIAWSRDYGKGRMFYTALGHRREVWVDPLFLTHLTSGIRWAMRSENHLAKAPKGATILFDGTNLEQWTHQNGKKPAAWTIKDNTMTVAARSGSIITKKKFGDCHLHVEFKIPAAEEGQKGQGKGNSGVYVQRRYEVQILDSFGLPTMKNGCASLYRTRKPDANASRKPDTWQSYDIYFTAARFGDDGKKTNNARFTVIHNDVIVHNDIEIPNKTGAGSKEGPEKMPLLLQDHGNPVSFRNIWIVEK